MSLLETSTSVSGDSQTTDAIALCPYSRVRAIVTRVHAARLEAILQNLAEHANGEKCQGMQGLIGEAFECVNAAGADEVREAGLVGAHTGSNITRWPDTRQPDPSRWGSEIKRPPI